MRALIVLLALASTASSVAAQAGGRLDATETYEAGIRAMELEDWVAAEVLFRQALRETPTDRVRLHLARTLAEQGKLIEAGDLARGVARSDDLLLADAGDDLRASIERRLGSVVVSATTPADELRVDGRPVVAGTTTTVNPGLVVVQALRSERVIAERTVRVPEGERVAVELDGTESAVAPPSPRETALASEPVAAGSPSVALDEDPSRRRRRLGIGLGAAAAVVLSVAVILAVTLRGSADPTNGDVPPLYLEVSE